MGRAPRRDPPRLGRLSCAALIWAFPSACSHNEVILMGNQHPRQADASDLLPNSPGQFCVHSGQVGAGRGVHPGLGSHQRKAGFDAALGVFEFTVGIVLSSSARPWSRMGEPDAVVLFDYHLVELGLQVGPH